MFSFERWQSAIASIHLHRFHGVDLMVIPIISVVVEVYNLLREYEKEGWIKLKRAGIIPQTSELNYDPNSESDWFGQEFNFNECLYEYRENTQFIAFIDLDDIIFSRDTYDLFEAMSRYAIERPTVASFEFDWVLASAVMRELILSVLNFLLASDPNNFDLTTSIKSMRFHSRTPYGKSIVRPRLTTEGYIHRPRYSREGILPGYKHARYSNDSLIVVHLRNLHEGVRS